MTRQLIPGFAEGLEVTGVSMHSAVHLEYNFNWEYTFQKWKYVFVMIQLQFKAVTNSDKNLKIFLDGLS